MFNEGSFSRDHGAYTGNVEQVIGPLHDLLALSTVDTFVARHVVERRVRRVRARSPLRVLTIATGFALATPIVRFTPWPVGGAAMVATIWLSTVVLAAAWDRWNRSDAALALTRPGAVAPVGPTVGVIAVWSVLALTAEAFATIGVDLDEIGGLLRFASGWGRGLTLVFAPLVIGLIVTTDYRAYGAARRATEPPPTSPTQRPGKQPKAGSM